MFERWADTVAAIPIDDAGRPQAQAVAKSAPADSKLKIDLVDHIDSAAKDFGVRTAVSAVDAELASLRRSFSTDSPAPAPAAPPAAEQAAGGWMAQLASLPSRAAAETAWTKLKASHPDVLGRLAARFDSVDLGGRGVWTRVQAGPFPSRAEAEAVCSRAGIADRWCVATRRG